MYSLDLKQAAPHVSLKSDGHPVCLIPKDSGGRLTYMSKASLPIATMITMNREIIDLDAKGKTKGKSSWHQIPSSSRSTFPCLSQPFECN